MKLLAGLVARLRLAPRGAAAGDLLCIAVSELGWHTVLTGADGQAPVVNSARVSPDAADPFEVLRRAVRSVTAPQRERIGRVRLLVDDPAIALLDNRSLRLKSDDPVAIRQAGAQELGATGATYAFQPFGASSEHEVPRGVYAFLSTTRMQDYLGALDSLAVKLVELVPAGLLHLLAGGDVPFALIDVGASASTLLLTDPQTGLACRRELPLGVHRLAASIAEATSVSVADAASGLERRACFAPDAAGEAAPPPMTATEKAIVPALAAVREQLLASVDYFVYQRLASPPDRLALAGEVDRVRGLAAWLGTALELPAEPGPDLLTLFTDQPAFPACNLLATVPKGLLKIGKAEYRFADGRFVTEERHKTASVAVADAPAPKWMQALETRLAGAAGPVCAVIILLVGAIAAAVTAQADSATLSDANTTLASALLEDGILRSAVAKRSAAGPADAAPTLYWAEKLGAIAAAMPDDIRLLRLTSSANGPTATHDSKFTVEGEAPPGGDSLRQVDDLIRRLRADPHFMQDVADISFDGSTVTDRGATSESAHAPVRFVLTVALRPPA